MQTQRLSLEEINQIRKTGTTTIGIICKDALIVGSETKSTLGYLVASKESQKIYQVDDKIAITTAGASGDASQLVRIMKAEIQLYKNLRSVKEFTVNAAIHLLANILQGSRYYPYYAMLIVAGHDNKSGFHLYTIDPIGGYDEDRQFTATGSGSPMAYGVMEAEYKEGMTKEEGIRLAIRAIKAAKERDIGSGGKLNIVVIEKNKMEFLSEDKIKDYDRPEKVEKK